MTTRPRGAIQALALVTALGILSACAGLADKTAAVLSPEQLAKIESVCRSVQPVLDLAAGSHMPDSVSDVAKYPKAYCDQLLAGSVPATTDENTPAWLANVLWAVQKAADAAGVILPMVK